MDGGPGCPQRSRRSHHAEGPTRGSARKLLILTPALAQSSVLFADHTALGDAEPLSRVVAEFRTAAERVARDTEHPVFRGFPGGCCKLTSFMLTRFLNDRGFGKAIYVWGDPATKPGESDTHGRLHLNGLLIDVTGDQFPGRPGSVFIGAESSWHRQFPPLDPDSYDRYMTFSENFAATFASLYNSILDALPKAPVERNERDAGNE
jgi:hypothetical protein